MIAKTLPGTSRDQDLNLATLYQHYTHKVCGCAERQRSLTGCVKRLLTEEKGEGGPRDGCTNVSVG